MIIIMPYGESQEHEAPPSLEEKDLTWNTHIKIREWFGVSLDQERFGEWLDWFYNCLNQEQRRWLRNTNLSYLNKDEFPRPPFTKE